MAFETKVRRIGTSLGVIIPKEKLDELGVGEGDTIIISRIEKPTKEIHGILKGRKFKFVRKVENRNED